jgi:chaperonin GroEL
MVEGTLGPKGMNAIIDRPIGSPLVSRDGVTIVSQVELLDRFENMGAQIAREVSVKTNEVVGDGTTTALIIANALVQGGTDLLEGDKRPVDVIKGIDTAVDAIIAALTKSAKTISTREEIEAVASIAAADEKLGALVAEAVERVGPDGIITTDFGVTVDSTVEVVDGMSFDRGYISHHMVTDVETMTCVLDNAYILITDNKITAASQLEKLRREVRETGRPLLIIAEEVAPQVITSLLSDDPELGKGKIGAIHPPEYGHWRRAMLEDLAILIGGRVIARELGGRVEDARIEDLGSAELVRVSANETIISKGAGDPVAIAARKEQIVRQQRQAPPNVEQDKLNERLAKMTGGTAIIYGGGATLAEQTRLVQLIDDSVSATRAAVEAGVIAGGGTALIQASRVLDDLANAENGDIRDGILLVQSAMSRPLAIIVANSGFDADEIVSKVRGQKNGIGFDGRTGQIVDLAKAGVIDPAKVTCTALQNAASIAKLILTTDTLIADLPEDEDPTFGPALGGGAEKLGRA